MPQERLARSLACRSDREWKLGSERECSTGYEHTPLERGVGTDLALHAIAAARQKGAQKNAKTIG